MRDNLNITAQNNAKPAKLKGKAIIELRDAETGKLEYRKEEHNLVTNIFQGPYDMAVIGSYCNQKRDYMDTVQGIVLDGETIAADPSIIEPPPIVTGWGNKTVNSAQTDLTMMSYNLVESGEITNGYRYVWDANPNQCNGTIKNISLIASEKSRISNYYKNLTNFEVYKVGVMPLYLGLTSEKSDVTDLSLGTFTNVIHIDWENEWMYDLELEPTDYTKLILKKYNMNKNKIYMKYRFKPLLLEEKTIILTNPIDISINYTSDTNKYYIPFIAKIENDNLYLVQIMDPTTTSSTNNYKSNQMRIIKINITDGTYTDKVVSLTKYVQSIYPAMTNTTVKAYNRIFIKDLYPIRDGYVYLPVHKTKQIMKINLEDESNVTYIDWDDNSTYSQSAQTSYLFPSIVGENNILILGAWVSQSDNFHYSLIYNDKCYDVVISDVRNMPISYRMLDKSPYTFGSGGYMYFYNISMCDYTNGVATFIGHYNGFVVFVQHTINGGRITINNVTPVTKTSDKTMRITYELTTA